MKKTHYAVKQGRKCGVIVKSWEQCRKLVEGYSGAKFKGFSCHEDAKEWLGNKEKPNIEGKIQTDGTIFIPASHKKDKYGYYKPRYYAIDGITMAHHGTTIGCNCDTSNLYRGELPPW